VQRRTRDNTKPQSHCGTEQYSLHSRQRRQCTPKTRIVHRAYEAATIPHIFPGRMHTSRACRLAPPSPLPSHHKHARIHTRHCDKSHPPQQHVSVMARVTQHCADLQATHATSRTRTQHTNTQTPHARTTSHTAATTAHCAIITARTPPHTCHTQHGNPTRRPQKITPSHTRGLRATLTAELSGCSASTGCCRRAGFPTSSTACRTHEQPSRHTMAPDAAADPSQPPAAHRSAAHTINQLKSNESQSAHCMLSRTHNTVCE
jgi:hypothetical protein